MRKAWRSSFPASSRQTTKSEARDLRSVEEPFDLDRPPPDAVRFVPVDLRRADLPVLEADERDPFELAPVTFAISFRQYRTSPELPAGGFNTPAHAELSGALRSS